MKVKPKPPSAALQPQPAARGEIDQAIEALTEEHTERIEQTALNRIYRIGRAANGRSHDDLIQEALTRILDGKRQWYKDRVLFPDFLIGAIYSIASEWAGHRERNAEDPEYAALEAALSKTDEEGKTTSPFDGLQDPSVNPEQGLITAEEEEEKRALVEEILTAFKDDEKASIILMGFEDGMGVPEIRAEFQMSEKEYRTTMRRIRWRVGKMMGEHHGR